MKRTIVFILIVFLSVAVWLLKLSQQALASVNNFRVTGTKLIHAKTGQSLFLKGIGYSPYFPEESPHYMNPPNDNRYIGHLSLIKSLNANFLHVFPQFMPENFFTALDQTGFIYAQDIYVDGWTNDLLDETFLNNTIAHIKKVIDHTYAKGRPDKLVFFSVGDEINAGTIYRTDTSHPGIRNFAGNYITITNRTPSEVAIAGLIDAAMTYEQNRYGVRHLFTHTSWTHIGPVPSPDLEVAPDSIFFANFADLICMNIYTYARGVKSSPPGSVTGTTYQGYLEDLIKISTKPVIITQVGLSTSPIAPNPEIPEFGGNREEKVCSVYFQVWADVKTAAGAHVINGLAWFEFMDEWWKNDQSPDEFFHEENDPEEWFGLYSINEDKKSLSPKGRIPGTVQSLFLQPTAFIYPLLLD
jgi:hypothetical protein